jgi:hypothetical protein
MFHQKNKKITLKQKNRQLKILKINFFNLIAARNTEKALKVTIIFIKAVKKCVNTLEYHMNDASRNNNSKENSNENIIKIIQSEIKAAVQTAI